MDRGTYAEIRLREDEHRGTFGPLLYKELFNRLKTSQTIFATVLRATQGTDWRGNMSDIFSEASPGLPMVIQIYDSIDQVQKISSYVLNSFNEKNRLLVLPARDVKQSYTMGTEGDTNMQTVSILKIYTNDEDQFQRLPLYRAMLVELRKRGMMWVTVHKGLDSIEEGRPVRKGGLFRSNRYTPILVEVVGTKEDILRFVKENHIMLQSSSGPVILLEGQLYR